MAHARCQMAGPGSGQQRAWKGGLGREVRGCTTLRRACIDGHVQKWHRWHLTLQEGRGLRPGWSVPICTLPWPSNLSHEQLYMSFAGRYFQSRPCFSGRVSRLGSHTKASALGRDTEKMGPGAEQDCLPYSLPEGN